METLFMDFGQGSYTPRKDYGNKLSHIGNGHP